MNELEHQLTIDSDRFAQEGLPAHLEDYVLEHYGFSLESEYAGCRIKNPFGKASGQLSLTLPQIEHDALAGLGFGVLKTVIAVDNTGSQSMSAWAQPASRMIVERIRGTRDDVRGEEGYTVTWKGRGWSESFEEYLALFDQALGCAKSHDMLVVPSFKGHLPKPDEKEWRVEEYRHTLSQLRTVWLTHSNTAMPIEKDFSPTLAGDDDFSREKQQILEWLQHVPELVTSLFSAEEITLGLKLFNAKLTSAFQQEILCAAEHANYLVYGNRLFDPDRSFDGSRGVAYGGPDLSSRNLEVLSSRRTSHIPLSATGNILTGQMAFEYLKHGATSFQMHTLFQLPSSEFEMKRGTRSKRALHRLLFHPMHGFIAAILREWPRRQWKDGITVGEMASDFVHTNTDDRSSE